MTPSGIDSATFRFVPQCLNQCATACPRKDCHLWRSFRISLTHEENTFCTDVYWIKHCDSIEIFYICIQYELCISIKYENLILWKNCTWQATVSVILYFNTQKYTKKSKSFKKMFLVAGLCYLPKQFKWLSFKMDIKSFTYGVRIECLWMGLMEVWLRHSGRCVFQS
jgi:hypothetical protein